MRSTLKDVHLALFGDNHLPEPAKTPTLAEPSKVLPTICIAAMLALDTNTLARLLVRGNAKQAKAADQFIAKGAWVSHLVLAETLWVLQAVYNRTAAQMAAALDLLLEHESLMLQDAETVRSALTQFQLQPALGFSNFLVLEIARKAWHLPLATFDKALAKLGGAQKL